MKSIIVTDLHTGEFSHGFVDPKTGYNSRLLDVYRRFNKLIKYCINNNIQNIIIAGDIYDLKTPKNLIREIFATIVNKTISNKLKLYVLIGNHDISSSSGHALAEMEKLSSLIDGLTIISKPQKIVIGGIDFLFHPFNPFNKQEDNHNELMVLSGSKNRSVLIGHFATNKNTYVVDEDEKEKLIDFDFLKSCKFDMVFLGHIHNHYKLDDHIWHIGSFTRTSFNEENECKYIVEFDHNNFMYEFIEFDDRKFKTFVYDNNIEFFEKEILHTNLADLVTRFTITMDENDINHEKIDKLQSYVKEKSWNFIGTVKKIIKKNNTFTMTEKTSPVDAFKIYCNENRDSIGEDYFDDCIKNGLMLLAKGNQC